MIVLFRFGLSLVDLPPLATALLLVRVVCRRNLQDFLDYQVIVLEILLLPVLEGGELPVDAVKHLGIDANLGHPRPLGPLLVAILEFLADSPQEDVQGGVGGHFVERLLGVVSTE